MNPAPAPDAGVGKSYPGERQTRLSAVWTAVGVAILALVAILVFILENPSPVELSFLMFNGRLPLAIALLFAMLLGAVIVLAFGAARILQLRGVARRARQMNALTVPPTETPAPADDLEATPVVDGPSVPL
ncbi:MAG TPA: lipopolysaccharide assembly protein LapA domain-containing protein [Candidatus Acidoferrales bacterium]|nr:lipopolysaccharide assembly protein LapA domain-containing protein [Candidatus Acidoferrales bacterium]